jgi:molecular chaperone DnaK
MAHAIGIDLGTTNTVVAAVVDGVAITLEDEQGRRLLPSVVSFHPSGTVLVGDSARERRLIDPDNTIFSVKQLIGRPFDSDEVKAARKRVPFQFIEGAKNCTMVLARDVAYALPEISAFVLRRAKAIAEHALGGPVDRAVITVPANFNDLQRASTKIAGKLAGLEVLRILNEPTAAALAYGQSIAKAEKIAVYDLGGGTFDITLLDLTGNVFEVLATAGDTALGGDDIDRLLADRISLEIIKKFNYDPRSSPVVFARLCFMAEAVKKQLSMQHAVDQDISGIGYTEGGVPITMRMTIRRDELDRLALPLIERTISVAKQSMEIIGLKPTDFDRVILVGGSTRMPLAARLVETLFGQPPHLKVNPDEVVALGASIQAHALNRSKGGATRKSAQDQLAGAHGSPAPGNNVASRPPAPLPSGTQRINSPRYVEYSKAAAVITFSPPPSPHDPRSAPALVEPPGAQLGAIVPAGDFVPSFEAAENTRSAARDEAFSRGSAIETSARAPLLIDVTPLSLRVETVGGYSDVLIAANSPVPCEKTRTFLTASDNQIVVFIRVAQGESSRFSENTRLGELELSGLKPGTRGQVKIQVTFELDADGILNVRAKDQDTNRETTATMRFMGASTDAAEVNAMQGRQARHVVA